MESYKTFVEAKGIDEANKIDMSLYSRISYDQRTDKYIFQRRTKKV